MPNNMVLREEGVNGCWEKNLKFRNLKGGKEKERKLKKKKIK